MINLQTNTNDIEKRGSGLLLAAAKGVSFRRWIPFAFLAAVVWCSPQAFAAARIKSKKAENSAPPPTALVVQPVDTGYRVSGNGFSILLTKNGSVSEATCHGQPLFERGYLEVRDKTWHVKLYPRDEQVKVFPPYSENNSRKFQYAIQLDDAATGIRAAVDELIIVRPRGELQIILSVTPQSSFEAHRISWNIEFPTSQLVNTACTWRCPKSSQNTMLFPTDRSTEPELAKAFEWIRLNRPDGPIDFRFDSSDAKKQAIPVENTLEDLRWWNKPSFWIASAVPFSHENGDATKPFQAEPGDTHTLRVTMLLHCGDRN